jgi:hypothetical protein
VLIYLWEFKNKSNKIIAPNGLKNINMGNQKELKWHQKTTPVILLLFFFFPVGLYLMWKNEMWSKTTRWIVTSIFAFAIIANAGGNKSNDKSGVEASQYSFQENGVAAVITIGDKNLCNIITVTGEFKSMSRGTYSVQGNTLIFNWDNLGPREATISNENGQEILIVKGSEGSAIYRKNVK